MADPADYQDIHPGRCTHLQVPWHFRTCNSTIPISVSVVDAPLGSSMILPFAAIVVPRGRELDWIFSTPNGLWDLLFSASTFRLVVLRRQNSIERDDRQKHSLHGFSRTPGSLNNIRVTSEISRANRKEVHGTKSADQISFKKENDSSTFENAKVIHDDNAANNSLFSEQISDGNNVAKEISYCGIVGKRNKHGNSSNDVAMVKEIHESNRGDGEENFKEDIYPLLECLFPWCQFPEGLQLDPFVSYEDHVSDSLVVDLCRSPLVGDIVVEDVELNLSSEYVLRNESCLRRRMRFREMPNLIQTEVLIVVHRNGEPDLKCHLADLKTKTSALDFEVRLNHSKLVHKYLRPIVAGLILVSNTLEACVQLGSRARVLSVGVGGGALPLFLSKELGCYVLAVDTDEVVVNLARHHFGLSENENLHVKIEDGIDTVIDIAQKSSNSTTISSARLMLWQEICGSNTSPVCNDIDGRMHVIIVDVNAGNPCLGLMAPPLAFLSKMFLAAASIALKDGGMLVLNVIPRDEDNFRMVVDSVQEFFSNVYQIQDEDYHVLFALSSEVLDIDLKCNVALKLMQVIDNDLLNKIEEVH